MCKFCSATEDDYDESELGVYERISKFVKWKEIKAAIGKVKNSYCIELLYDWDSKSGENVMRCRFCGSDDNEGESVSIKIHYCPICGRSLDNRTIKDIRKR